MGRVIETALQQKRWREMLLFALIVSCHLGHPPPHNVFLGDIYLPYPEVNLKESLESAILRRLPNTIPPSGELQADQLSIRVRQASAYQTDDGQINIELQLTASINQDHLNLRAQKNISAHDSSVANSQARADAFSQLSEELAIQITNWALYRPE